MPHNNSISHPSSYNHSASIRSQGEPQDCRDKVVLHNSSALNTTCHTTDIKKSADLEVDGCAIYVKWISFNLTPK